MQLATDFVENPQHRKLEMILSVLLRSRGKEKVFISLIENPDTYARGPTYFTRFWVRK